MTRFLSAALLVLIAAPLAAQSRPATPKTVWPDEGAAKWAPRPTKSAIDANDLRTRLYQIADDSMMGREAGTLGAYMATEYIAREYQRLGLKPGGENGTWFQNLPLGPNGFDVSLSELSVAGKRLAPISEWIPMLPSAFNGISNRFANNGAETVFGGRWGDTEVALDSAKVAGKIVVFLPAAVAAAPAVPAGRGGGRGGVRTVRDQRAQHAGAAGVLVAGLEEMPEGQREAAFTRRIVMEPTRNTDVAGVAGATITTEAAASLFGAPLEQLAPHAGGKAVSGKWVSEWTMSVYPGRNVIGILTGSDPVLRNEFVLLGAHNDHDGMVEGTPAEHDSLRAFNKVMRPQGANDRPPPPSAEQWAEITALIARARSIRPARLDTVMNGADDDGSGTAVLLEVAERFASENAPARSVVFNSHTGEEKGLLGSKWFVDHPTLDLTKVVAALNMDMLGKGRVTDVQYGGPASVQMLGSRRLSDEYGQIVDSLNAVRSEPMAIDYSWDRTNALNRFCRSDQVSYFNKQIPVSYFSLGYASDYHQASDEPAYIDFEHSARVARFVHEIGWTIANRPERLQLLSADKQDKSASCTR